MYGHVIVCLIDLLYHQETFTYYPYGEVKVTFDKHEAMLVNIEKVNDDL